jgi:ABC-type multidrug transport system ATPase subunit
MIHTLNVTHATKSYPEKYLLGSVSLTMHTGDIIGVFGRNGSGKSTLLQMIFGTIKSDSIALKIDGTLIVPKNIIASQQISYLPQASFLPKNKKVREVITLFFSESESQNAIFYAPNVSNFDYKKVGELSLGQIRYLEFLIIAHLNHPFLLLDEPFSMVEPIYKDAIKDYIVKLKPTKGIIVTDHYYEDVLQITNKNYLIKETRLIPIEGKDDLLKNDYLKFL